MTPFRIFTGTFTRDIWERSFLAYQQKFMKKYLLGGRPEFRSR